MKNFLSLAALIVVGSFLIFLYDCVVGLSVFAGRIDPALTPWVFWILFTAVAGTLGWGLAVAFFRPRPMMVHADPTPEDMAQFRKVLTGRLAKNRHLLEAGVIVRDEEDLDAALTALNTMADEEIQSTAKRVFIGTAVSQNGRLDTLVVLFLITRLTWRISKLYNQRPHPRELMNLYANIAATSFLAGSIEEFGIDEYVRELMGPLVGGSAIGAVPGAQAIAGAITASVLTGSTNCLLALRCGIVARDYMSLKLEAKGSMRRSATLEASKMFVSISAETVTYVTKTLVKGSAGAVKSGTAKAVRGVGKTVSGTADSVADGAKSVRDTVKNAADSVGQGAAKGAAKARQATGKTTEKMKQAGHAVVEGMGEAVDKIDTGAHKASQAIHKVADKVTQRVSQGAAKVRQAAKQTRNKMKEIELPTDKDARNDKAEASPGKAARAVQKGKDAARTLLGRFRRR